MASLARAGCRKTMYRQTKINKNFNLFNDYGDGYGIISSSNANHNISFQMQKSFALEREVGGGWTGGRTGGGLLLFVQCQTNCHSLTLKLLLRFRGGGGDGDGDVVNVIELLFLRKSKIEKLEKVCSDVWNCTQKCENIEAISKQNNTLKLFNSFKIAFSWCFSLEGNLDFPDFLQK